MADWIDQSVGQQEAIAKAEQSYRKPEGPEATGFCLFCDNPQKGGKAGGLRWCDGNCRDDWQADQKARRMRVRD